MKSDSSALFCNPEDARILLPEQDVVRPTTAKRHAPYQQKPWSTPLHYTMPHTADEWAMVWSTAHKTITEWCRSALEQLPEDETLIRIQRLRATYHNRLSTCADDTSISLESLLFLRCLDDATQGSGVCWKFPFP